MWGYGLGLFTSKYEVLLMNINLLFSNFRFFHVYNCKVFKFAHFKVIIMCNLLNK